MINTPSSDNVLLGRGKILFDRFNSDGTRSGFIHLGNCDKLSISTSVESLEMANYMTSTTAPYKKVAKKTTVDVTIEGFEFAPSILAMVLSGDKVALTQSAATVTAESLASAAQAEKGKLYKTAKRNISAVAVKQGATTLVLGSDYEIFDAKAGIIRILPTSGTFAEGTAVTIDYTAAAIVSGDNLSIVRGATNSSIEGRLFFSPDNTTGPANEVEAWRVSLSPDGQLDLIGDDWAKWALKGSILDDSAGQYGGSSSSPYYELRKRA